MALREDQFDLIEAGNSITRESASMTIPIDPGLEPVLLLIGGITLILGRKLYWFSVGVAGFLGGLLVGALLQDQLEAWALLIAALVLGVAGLILALFLQRLAISVAGFIMGGFIVATGMNMWQPTQTDLMPLYFLIGGGVGTLLVMTLFQWGLILISSFAGASLIIETEMIQEKYKPLALLFLIIIGIWIQSQQLKSAKEKPDSK